MVPERFIFEYAQRSMDLLTIIETQAHQQKLVGSFALIVATSVFMIPYERAKKRHPLYEHGQDGGLYDSIRAVEKQKFLKAAFWQDDPPTYWRFSRILKHVNLTDEWLDEDGRHPMAGGAGNSIRRRKVNDVLRVLRNALAHGNVVYLDENGLESKGAKVQYLAFLSRYEETEEDRKKSATYRLVATTEEQFLSFVKQWAKWLSTLPPDSELVEAAE